MKKSHLVFQFKVSLLEIQPSIWRRIQVPAKYSFWDLHVAIQDAMGWFDCHLHAFRFSGYEEEFDEIGIPGDEFDDQVVLPGWEIPITDFFKEPGEIARYEYDFGDGWQHELLFEGILLKEKRVKYPRCLSGEGTCPPEDCGGVTGYYSMLEILSNPSDEDYEDMVSWLKGHFRNYFPFNPLEFDAKSVKFDNPGKRWDIAFLSD